MRHWLLILALLFAPAWARGVRGDSADANNGNGNANGNGNNGNGKALGRGKKSGGYTMTIAGDYSGTGTITVSDSAVSLTLVLQRPNGAPFTLTCSNLPLVNDRFQGTATGNGLTFTINGRVDLPAATDQDQTPDQAITGRVTALIADSSGKGIRVVAVQDTTSRGNGASGG